MFLHQGCEGSIDIAFRAGGEEDRSHTTAARRRSKLLRLERRLGISGVDKSADCGSRWHEIEQQAEFLGVQVGRNQADTSDVAVGPAEPRDWAGGHRGSGAN